MFLDQVLIYSSIFYSFCDKVYRLNRQNFPIMMKPMLIKSIATDRLSIKEGFFLSYIFFMGAYFLLPA